MEYPPPPMPPTTTGEAPAPASPQFGSMMGQQKKPQMSDDEMRSVLGWLLEEERIREILRSRVQTPQDVMGDEMRRRMDLYRQQFQENPQQQAWDGPLPVLMPPRPTTITGV